MGGGNIAITSAQLHSLRVRICISAELSISGTVLKIKKMDQPEPVDGTIKSMMDPDLDF
jgi:hypothetical protein